MVIAHVSLQGHPAAANTRARIVAAATSDVEYTYISSRSSTPSRNAFWSRARRKSLRLILLVRQRSQRQGMHALEKDDASAVVAASHACRAGAIEANYDRGPAQPRVALCTAGMHVPGNVVHERTWTSRDVTNALASDEKSTPGATRSRDGCGRASSAGRGDITDGMWCDGHHTKASGWPPRARRARGL